MKACTVVISHYESLSFLKACVRQLLKHQHSEVYFKIIICDQSDEETHVKVMEEFAVSDSEDLMIVKTNPLYSGYGIDFLLHNDLIDTEYMCQIHVDAFPIHPNWLYLPIKLIEEYDLAFAGQLQFIFDGKPDSIYPPSPIFCMAQCFNVGKTETWKELSLEAGFTRYHNRPQSGLSWKNSDWSEWAAEDYTSRGSDDDVVAFHWQDKYKTADKIGLAISGYIEPSFGRIIDGIVFHFGSANESRGVMGEMPELYQEYTRRINENYSDELIEEMIERAKANRPPNLEILSRNFWDGKLKVSTPTSEEINNRIEELKK